MELFFILEWYFHRIFMKLIMPHSNKVYNRIYKWNFYIFWWNLFYKFEWNSKYIFLIIFYYFVFIKFQWNMLVKSNFNIPMKLYINFHKTPLHLAVEKGNKSIIVLLLVSRNININLRDEILFNLIEF